MATTIGKYTLTFGMVALPVKLFTAISDNTLSLNLLHTDCHGRIQLQNFCPQCGKTVERSELVKGYSYEKDKYVVLSEEDVKEAVAEKEAAIDILRFVDESEIDPIFYDRPYFLAPDAGGNRAFAILTQVLLQERKMGVVQFVLRSREHLAVVRASKQFGLILQIVAFPEDVRENEYKGSGLEEVSSKELELASMLVDNLVEPFDSGHYVDSYRQNLTKIIEARIQNKERPKIVSKKKSPQLDLMEALTASVVESEKKKAKKRSKAS